MSKVWTALAIVGALVGTPAAAGVYVDVTYSGTATGYSPMFDAGQYNYTDEAFSVVYKFYEDEGPELDYNLGAVFTLAGVDYLVEGSARSYDGLANGTRISQVNHNRPATETTPWLLVFLQSGLVSPDHPDSRIVEYDTAGQSLNYSNKFFAYGPGVLASFNLTTNSISVSTRAGDPPPGVATSLAGYVPEPGSWALLILGFAGTGAMLRRRRIALA